MRKTDASILQCREQACQYRFQIPIYSKQKLNKLFLQQEKFNFNDVILKSNKFYQLLIAVDVNIYQKNNIDDLKQKPRILFLLNFNLFRRFFLSLKLPKS